MAAGGISPGMGVVLIIDTLTTPQTVGEVVSVSGPGYSKTQIETTSLGLSDHFRTYMQGINDGGEFGVQVQLDADDVGQVKVLAELESDVGSTILSWSLTLKDEGTSVSSSWTFLGIITKADFGGMDIDGRITLDLTIKVSGKPAYVPAADI